MLGWAGVAAAGLGLGAHTVETTRPLFLGIAAMAPYLMTGSLVGLVLLAVVRRWVGTVLAAVLLAGAIATQAPLYVASPAPRDGVDLHVMTANLRLGQAEPAAVVAAVRRHRVDVLMVQELTTDELARLGAAGLDRLLPSRLVAPGNGATGTGLWSRYPLSAQQMPRVFTAACVAARVSVPGLATRPMVIALHLLGPVPDSGYWDRDVARLPAFLRTRPAGISTVVGGDFNATTDTVQFRDALVDGFRDAAGQAGAGHPRTWPANRAFPPLIAIDHVLTRQAVGTAVRTVTIAGSDHRALLATVRLPR